MKIGDEVEIVNPESIYFGGVFTVAEISTDGQGVGVNAGFVMPLPFEWGEVERT